MESATLLGDACVSVRGHLLAHAEGAVSHLTRLQKTQQSHSSGKKEKTFLPLEVILDVGGSAESKQTDRRGIEEGDQTSFSGVAAAGLSGGE